MLIFPHPGGEHGVQARQQPSSLSRVLPGPAGVWGPSYLHPHPTPPLPLAPSPPALTERAAPPNVLAPQLTLGCVVVRFYLIMEWVHVRLSHFLRHTSFLRCVQLISHSTITCP